MKRITCCLVLGALTVGSQAIPTLLQSMEVVSSEMPPGEFSAEATRVEELCTETVIAWKHESRLCLVLRSLPADQKLRIPRLANSLKSIYWLVVPDDKMNLQPELPSGSLT